MYLLNSTLKQLFEHEGAEALPRCSWIFIHGCMLLICFVICNIIRLLSVFVLDHCVDSYHFLGVYTELAALTSAPKSVAGARPHFSLSVDDIDMLVNQWLQFTCSHSYLAIEAYSSRCGLAWNVHPLLCPSIPFQDASWNSTPFSPRRDPQFVGSHSVNHLVRQRWKRRWEFWC